VTRHGGGGGTASAQICAKKNAANFVLRPLYSIDPEPPWVSDHTLLLVGEALRKKLKIHTFAGESKTSFHNEDALSPKGVTNDTKVQ